MFKTIIYRDLEFNKFLSRLQSRALDHCYCPRSPFG